MTSNPRQPVARPLASTAHADPLRDVAPTLVEPDGNALPGVPHPVPFALRSRGPNRPRWLPYTAVADRVRPSYIGFSDAESLARFIRMRATILG